MMKNVVYSQLEGLDTDTELPAGEVDFSLYPSFKVCGFKIAHMMNMRDELKGFPLNHYFNTVLAAPLSINSFVAVKEITEEENIIPPVQARYELEALTSCFRLFQRGFVGWGISFFYDLQTKHGGMFGTTLRDSGIGMAYRLEEKRISSFIVFAEKIFPFVLELEKAKGELMFKFFKRGLNDTLRWEFKSSIVDYFIALESIYKLQKNGSSNDSILKASLVKGKSAEERIVAYKKLKLLKVKRNEIVHGTYKKYDMDELQNDCIYLEDVIRENLKKILSYEVSGKGYGQFLKDIEQIIYGGATDLPDSIDLL